MKDTIDLKEIQIGKLIEMRWKEMEIPMERTCNFFKLKKQEILEMFEQEDISSEYLLKWSKLLEYDFFRLYSQHLILYSPQKSIQYNSVVTSKTKLPQFRKNLYTKNVINFILDLVKSGTKTKQEIIDEYKIPKTTLYKWIGKYRSEN